MTFPRSWVLKKQICTDLIYEDYRWVLKIVLKDSLP